MLKFAFALFLIAYAVSEPVISVNYVVINDGYPEDVTWNGQRLTISANIPRTVYFNYNDSVASLPDAVNVTATLENLDCNAVSPYLCVFYLSLPGNTRFGVSVNPTAPSGRVCAGPTGNGGACSGFQDTFIQMTGPFQSVRNALQGVIFSQSAPATSPRGIQRFRLTVTGQSTPATLMFNVDTGPGYIIGGGYGFLLGLTNVHNTSQWIPIERGIVCAAGYSNSRVYAGPAIGGYLVFLATTVGELPAAMQNANDLRTLMTLAKAEGINGTSPLARYTPYYSTPIAAVNQFTGPPVYDCGGYLAVYYGTCIGSPNSCSDATQLTASLALVLLVVASAFKLY